MLQLDFLGSFAAGVRGRLAIRNLAQDDIPSDLRAEMMFSSSCASLPAGYEVSWCEAAK